MEDDPANIAWTIFARVMDIRFNCPRCGQSLSVEEKGAGMVVNCPTCKGQIEIPRSTAPAPAPKLSVPTIPVKPGIKTATVLIIGGIILFAFLTQHKNSTQDIGQVVKTSMQEKFTSDPEFQKWDLTVVSVDVVRQSGNTYQGLAHVTYKGTRHDIPVDVTADGGNVLWKTPPGSFLFIAQDELKEKLEKIH